jgi:hypothetical protein
VCVCQQAPVSKRYLQCPALVTIAHLKKFLRLKYELNPTHLVSIRTRLSLHLHQCHYNCNGIVFKPVLFSNRIVKRNEIRTRVGTQEI